MNNKGYTLVELMVAIVIIGIIMGMSFPAIRKIQESNTRQKYEKYGESLIAAAKIYVDAYEEDLFIYEDDMTKDEAKNSFVTGVLLPDGSQCVFISYEDFANHALIKDINMNGLTCNSPNTFVRVIRKNNKYRYKYYLACGEKPEVNRSIRDNEVTIALPNGHILPLDGKYKERCAD